jgi:serine/threonine protein kinase
MHELAPGSVIAGYRIERAIGQGGMGHVYLATQLDLGRHVALKLIAPEYADDDRFRERFKQESRLAALIDHPNVIPVYEARDSDGFLFLAMRYVNGPDLRHLVRQERRLEPRRAVGIVAQVASALDAAHERGLVHRDVKPGNVLVTAGDPEHAYLTDFGLVKRTEGGVDLTASGQFVGTLDYTAPEQIQAQRSDARTDVYALGGVLYHALTGRVPFERETEAAKIYAHLNDPPPRPSELVDDLPEELDEVVTRAMAKEPADRFPSAGDVGRAMRAAVERRAASQPERSVATGEAAPSVAPATRVPEPEPATTPLRKPPRRARRRWTPLAGIIAAAAIAALVFVLVIARDGDETSAPSNQGPTNGPMSPDAHLPAGSRVKQLDAFETELLVTRDAPGMEQLAQRSPDGPLEPLRIPEAVDFAGADLGSAGPGGVLAVYSRCDEEGLCDVYRSVLGRPTEAPVPGADQQDCSEAGPSVAGGAIAFGIHPPAAPQCPAPGLYLKPRPSAAPMSFDEQWAGGTELNEGQLAWLVGYSIRVSPMDRYQPITVIHPEGHEFVAPVAIEGGRLYFVDRELAHGHTSTRYFIARTDARNPSMIERYGAGRAIPFKGVPNFAVAHGGDSLYFSGETDEDRESGLATITRDDEPRFKRWRKVPTRGG